MQQKITYFAGIVYFENKIIFFCSRMAILLDGFTLRIKSIFLCSRIAILLALFTEKNTENGIGTL